MKAALKINSLCLLLLLTAAGAPDSPVADAAMRGDIDEVRELLRTGADVNAAQGDGMTALHWAADNGDAGIAQILVYAGASLESITRLGSFTPLMVASREGNTDVIAALLGAGAKVDAVTETGERAIHLAAYAGSAEAVSLLSAHGADTNARELSSGQTPLMFAAAYGRADVVRVLMESGADPTLETWVVDYPAMAEEDKVLIAERDTRLSALFGEDIVSETPVDGTEVDYDEEAETEDDEAETEDDENESDDEEADEDEEPAPLIDRERLSYAQLVGKQGGNTALLYATREGHADVVEALVDGGADIDHVSGGDRTSPLLIATLNGHFDLAMSLLEKGADPTLQSAPGATALYAAVHLQWVPKSFYPQPTSIKQEQTTYLELMTALLDAGADPNARLERHLWYTSFNHNVLGVDTWGATPFWRAAYGTDVDAMKLLVAYGADYTTPTYRPPGRPSTGNGRDDGEKKKDPTGLPKVAVGGPGVFPIHAASGVGYGLGLAGNAHQHAPNGWLPSVKYLVEELGADVNMRDYNGFSPLHNAAARGDREMIEYLVEKGADVTVLTRKGETTADMANGPVQRVTVFPDIVALLESLGSENNHNCVSC
jgi:ankyrin repeat protein